MYIIIGRNVKILRFPAGDSRTRVSEAVVYATLNVVKYDVFPCARGMMYNIITLFMYIHIVFRGTGEEKIKTRSRGSLCSYMVKNAYGKEIITRPRTT